MASQQPTLQGSIGHKVLVVICAFLLLAAGILVAAASRTSSRWNAISAKLQADGEPVTLTDVAALAPRISDEKNLALMLDALAPEVTDLLETTGETPLIELTKRIDPFGGIPSDLIGPIRAVVRERESLVHRLRSLPVDGRGMPRRSWTHATLDNSSNSLRVYRCMARLAAANAWMTLLDGRTAEAPADVRLCWILSAAIGDDPTLIGGFTRLAIEGFALDLIEGTLGGGEVSEAVVVEWDAALVRLHTEDRLLWPFLGERAYSLEHCLNLLSRKPSPTGIGTVTDLNRIKIVNLYASFIEHRRDRAQLLDDAHTLETELAALSKLYLPTAKSVPSLVPFASTYATAESKSHCTRLALAAERYRMENGSLPDTLDALVPRYIGSVPIDPFDGKPIKLAVTANGITIYSAFTKGSESNPSGADPTEPDSNASFRLYRLEHRRPPRIIPAQGGK